MALYQSLKSIFNKAFLIRYEPIIRKIAYAAFIGSKYYCNICQKSLRTFIRLPNGEKSCIHCGSLPRNRRLYQISAPYLQDHAKVLDFSPSRCLYRKLKNKKAITYVSSDFAGEFIADKKYDIAAIVEPDKSFDLIFCYHILEHLVDDRAAMRELKRVLKPTGTCLIQTPFKKGDIYENPNVNNDEQRLLHFGQKDHVRIYSVNGLKDRLEAEGLQVEVLHFTEQEANKYGFSTEEFVLMASHHHKIHSSS